MSANPLVLMPASDSGVQGDNITNVRLASFSLDASALQIFSNFTVRQPRAGETVQLLINGKSVQDHVLSSDEANGASMVTLAIPAGAQILAGNQYVPIESLPDGSITVQAHVVTTGFSLFPGNSNLINLTLDTQAPVVSITDFTANPGLPNQVVTGTIDIADAGTKPVVQFDGQFAGTLI